MNLVLKIAAGVFLGMFTFLGVYKAVEFWEIHERTKAYIEQQKIEADTTKALIKHTAKNLQLELTPEELMARCGPPLKEIIGSFQRIAHYTGHDGHNVYLVFNCPRDSRCILFDMRRGDRTLYSEQTLADYEDFRGDDKTTIAMVEELPCLVPRQ